MMRKVRARKDDCLARRIQGIKGVWLFAKHTNCRQPVFFGVDMRLNISKRIAVKDFSIVLLLLLCSNKWIFEGILDEPILELAALLVGVAVVLLQKDWKLNRDSLMWLLFCFSIALSIFLNGDSISTWGRAGIMLAICLYAVVYPYHKLDFDTITRLLVGIAVFHAVALMMQFFFEEQFNAAYFPLLRDNSLISAKRYAKRGYYFGVLYAPHEVAGILMFAVAVLLARMAVLKKIRIGEMLLAILLVPPLLLTGKKGVIAVFAVVALLCVTILYWSKKDRHRIITIYALGAVAVVGVIAFMLTNPDNPFVYRFASYFTSLLSGEASNSGRTELYAYAIAEWKENPLFGIGWYQFTRRTTEVYGYQTAHQVNLDYLQWLAELGIVGFILNMIPISITFYRTVYICKNALRKEENSQEKIKLLFAVFVQFFTLIYAFIEVPFYDLYFFAIYILSCIMINGYYCSQKKPGENKHKWFNRQAIVQ